MHAKRLSTGKGKPKVTVIMVMMYALDAFSLSLSEGTYDNSYMSEFIKVPYPVYQNQHHKENDDQWIPF
jgi:hypothetical protein